MCCEDKIQYISYITIQSNLYIYFFSPAQKEVKACEIVGIKLSALTGETAAIVASNDQIWRMVLSMTGDVRTTTERGEMVITLRQVSHVCENANACDESETTTIFHKTDRHTLNR